MARSDPPSHREVDFEARLRETIARGVYDVRPFTLAVSGGVMEVMRVDKVLPWEEAPSFYRSECFEIADGVMARMLIDQQAEAGEALARTADAARVV